MTIDTGYPALTVGGGGGYGGIPAPQPPSTITPASAPLLRPNAAPYRHLVAPMTIGVETLPEAPVINPTAPTISGNMTELPPPQPVLAMLSKQSQPIVHTASAMVATTTTSAIGPAFSVYVEGQGGAIAQQQHQQQHQQHQPQQQQQQQQMVGVVRPPGPSGPVMPQWRGR